jgi:hypothetical protein
MAGRKRAICFQRASRKQQAIILSEKTNVLTGRILDMILSEAVW